jgi:nondiscriminating aspartyl-tRNA synthetase
MRVLAKDIGQYEGKEISVSGWIHRVRELGQISFLILRDRTGLIQVV